MLPCDRQAMFLLTIWLEVTLFSTFSSFEKLVEQGLEVITTACTAINIKTSKQAPDHKATKWRRPETQLSWYWKLRTFCWTKQSWSKVRLFSVLSSLHLNQCSQFSHKKSWKRSRCIKIHRFLSKSHCLSVFSILEVQEVNSTLNLVYEEFAET